MASRLTTLLFFGGIIAFIVIVGFFSLTASAIIILCFSAFFAAFLAERFPYAQMAAFAKNIAMVLFLIGIIMLFIVTNWKIGLAGIAGYWLLLVFSRLFWHKPFSPRTTRYPTKVGGTQEIRCPKCGAQTYIRTGKISGRKLHSCINYPRCKGGVYCNEWEDDDWGDEKPKQSEPTTVKTRFTNVTCPECGSKTTLRTSMNGLKYHVCINYPKCRGKVGGEEEKNEKSYCPKCGEEISEIYSGICPWCPEFDIECPVCGSKTIEERVNWGLHLLKFYVCVNYPKCRGKVFYQDGNVRVDENGTITIEEAPGAFGESD